MEKPKPKPAVAKVENFKLSCVLTSIAKVEKPRLPSTVGEAVKTKVRVEDLKIVIEEVQQR